MAGFIAIFSWLVMLAAGAVGYPVGYWTVFVVLAAVWAIIRLIRFSIKGVNL
jgi:hypothetical protein